AAPAAFCFLCNDVQPTSHLISCLLSPLRIIREIWVKRACNCCLLHHGPAVTGMETVEQVAKAHRIMNDFAKILAGADFTGCKAEAGIFQAAGDQIFLESLLVLEVLHRL